MTVEPIPFLDLVTPHRQLEEELVAKLRDALRGAAFVGGAEVDAFEHEFAEYCGATHCVGVANGTDALRFALMACGVGPGDAVVTVAHTFIATVEAISQAGAAAEFCDVDERTYTMCPRALEAYLESCRRDPATGRPRGIRSGMPIKSIVPVHLYGQTADMRPLLRLAERFGLTVVEDACQAHGAEYRLGNDGDLPVGDRCESPGWRRAGTLGRAAAFSFYPGKNLGACGEAGAVTTSDLEVARRIRMLRDHGQVKKYHHEVEGYNGRLDAIQAAWLRVKLRLLDAWNAQRREAARRYEELLVGTSLVLPREPDGFRSVYHLYVVQSVARDALGGALLEQGIQTGLHYPIPVHLQPCYRGWGYVPGSLPITERVASSVLSLPMFPGLTLEQQRRVAAALGAPSSAGALG
jgi:dTDP-4-amino-4,6-dideoxygalactose transaminase